MGRADWLVYHTTTTSSEGGACRRIMDQTTLKAYESGAIRFANDWHEQPAPTDLHALVRRFFRPGVTADIGCGSGREVAWLCANGYPAKGYDPSEGLLAQARARYPGLEFAGATLPDLTGVPDDSFDNVLCETVIMHLPSEWIAPSVARLMAILRPGGILYLSWRVTKDTHQRDVQGRLYSAFDKRIVLEALPDVAILLDEDVTSASSGKTIHRIVARRDARD
jgi:SAM-dependent methyltransferase